MQVERCVGRTPDAVVFGPINEVAEDSRTAPRGAHALVRSVAMPTRRPRPRSHRANGVSSRPVNAPARRCLLARRPPHTRGVGVRILERAQQSHTNAATGSNAPPKGKHRPRKEQSQAEGPPRMACGPTGHEVFPPGPVCRMGPEGPPQIRDRRIAMRFHPSVGARRSGTDGVTSACFPNAEILLPWSPRR